MKKLLIIAAAAVLAACSNMSGYYASVESSNQRAVEVEKARYDAEKARYAALQSIAERGDPTAQVAATMALAIGGAWQGMRAPMAVPSAPQNEALQWASVLVPGVTQIAGIYYNAQTSMRASDNATAAALSSNSTMLGLGGAIRDAGVAGYPYVQAPGAITTTTTTTEYSNSFNDYTAQPVIIDSGQTAASNQGDF